MIKIIGAEYPGDEKETQKFLATVAYIYGRNWSMSRCQHYGKDGFRVTASLDFWVDPDGLQQARAGADKIKGFVIIEPDDSEWDEW